MHFLGLELPFCHYLARGWNSDIFWSRFMNVYNACEYLHKIVRTSTFVHRSNLFDANKNTEIFQCRTAVFLAFLVKSYFAKQSTLKIVSVSKQQLGWVLFLKHWLPFFLISAWSREILFSKQRLSLFPHKIETIWNLVWQQNSRVC